MVDVSRTLTICSTASRKLPPSASCSVLSSRSPVIWDTRVWQRGIRRERACLVCVLSEKRDCGRTEALEAERTERLEGGRWVALDPGRDVFREDGRNDRLEGGRLVPWVLFKVGLELLDGNIDRCDQLEMLQWLNKDLHHQAIPKLHFPGLSKGKFAWNISIFLKLKSIHPFDWFQHIKLHASILPDGYQRSASTNRMARKCRDHSAFKVYSS